MDFTVILGIILVILILFLFAKGVVIVQPYQKVSLLDLVPILVS